MKTILLVIAVTALTIGYLRGQTEDQLHGFAVRATVNEGTLEGLYDTKTGVQKYFGVPFAQAPVGDLRWKAPQSPEAYDGVRKADRFGPRAIQQFIYDDMRFRSDGVSEDCLYLNVWSPAKKEETGLPVLLYFHGGGNTSGSGDELRYDGEALARSGIIVVTANYRLGVFGFLGHTDLNEGEPGVGNYGLLDQVAALEWVSENIEAFGGDPGKITIGGESAGSIDCSMLMASPLSRDLLGGVLGQSGAAIQPTFTPTTPAKASETAAAFLKATGYATWAELRAAPTREIYETATGSGYNFPAVIDGHFLPATLTDIYSAGGQAQVPLMVGWTSTEAGWNNAPESAAAYETQLKQDYGADTEQLLGYYPSSDLRDSYVQLASDKWIVYSTWRWADLHARTGQAPVYRYRFNRVRPPLKGQTRTEEPLGANHATDIEYFMNTLSKSDAYDWGAKDRTTAYTVSSYLVNFVKTGDPNGEDLPEWSAIRGDDPSPPVLHLDARAELRTSEVDDRYRFWAEYYSR